MLQFRFWSRWIGLVLVGLLFGTWVWAEAEQWLLQRTAAMLLSALQSIQVGRNTDEQAQSILDRWGKLEHKCSENGDSRCAFWITLRFDLPKCLRGKPDAKTRNILVSLVDDFGLRSSAVSAEVIGERGVVVSKMFSAEVDLPVRDWFLRDNAFVPSLLVSSEETRSSETTFSSMSSRPI